MKRRVPLLPEEPPYQAAGTPGHGPVRYLLARELARLLGMKPAAFEKLRQRHPTEKALEHDAQIGPGGPGTKFGWLPGREHQISAWRATLPGSGSAPRSGRWLAEAGQDGAGRQWVRLVKSRGRLAHLPADGEAMLCGLSGPSEPDDGRDHCRTCAAVAARQASGE